MDAVRTSSGDSWRLCKASRLDPGQLDSDDESRPRMRGGEADLAVVDLRDLLDDGQSQAAPAPDVGVEPHEALEHVVAQVFGNAGSIVLDLQVDAPGSGRIRLLRSHPPEFE